MLAAFMRNCVLTVRAREPAQGCRLGGERACYTVLHGSGSLAHWPLPCPGSSGADVIRASQLQHAVQDLDRHVHLSRPTLIRTRAQSVPDHALEPADGGLGPGARIV